MYQISNDYRMKMLDQIQTHKLSGQIGSVDFTGDDVVGVSYVNKCANKNVNIGGVNIGTLKLTFLTDILDRGDYYGKTITVSDSLLIGHDEHEEPIWEPIPLGVFYVAEATWRAEGMVDVVAYDCLSKLDKQINISTSSGQIYDFCKYIELQTGAVFGMTEEECLALPNGTEIISPYEDNNFETYRDLLSALAVMCGGFATAKRDGTWTLKTFNNTSILTVPKNRRMSGAKYSDYETLFDAISYSNILQGENIVIGDANGIIMKLGMNPFLQYGTVDAINRRANAILTAILPMTYTPYSVKMLPAFVCLDLGDVISFQDDYTESTSTGAVMSVTWTYNKSFSVSCFGDNPNLRSSQSKADKDISGILRQTTQNEVTYYNFSNVDEISIGSNKEVSVAKLAFTSAQKTTVKILHEFIMSTLADLGADQAYQIRYYLDNELLPYSPYERLGSVNGLSQGSTTQTTICRDFFYILKDVEPGLRHTWEVKILNQGTSAINIDVDNAHVTLEGQRLYGENQFSGYIEVKDILDIVPFGSLSLVSITETVDIDMFEAAIASSTDNISLYVIEQLSTVPIYEGTGPLSPHIFLELVEGYILTEAGDYLTTESGDRLIL